MPDTIRPKYVPLDDERLRELRDSQHVCTNEGERAMAAELIELRAYATDHEGTCNTLCPRCGIEVGVPVRTAELQVAEGARNGAAQVGDPAKVYGLRAVES